MQKQKEAMRKQRPRREMSVKAGASAKAPPPVQPAQCGSCIFREDGNQVELAPGRLDKIKTYLLRGTAHRCHHPEAEGCRKIVICRGGRDWQLQAWHRMGLIVAPTDEALTARMVELGLWRES